MTALGPKSESVTAEGEPDGWVPPAGFALDVGPGGATQLVVSVPPAHVAAVHRALVAVLSPPLGVLWRQVIDRRAPRPEGAAPVDHVGLDLPPERVLAALEACVDLVASDARGELWIKGRLGDQVILDQDGLIFCQPDDPAFRDVLLGEGLPAELTQSMADRDYVKHWYRGEADAAEDRLIGDLGLVRVAHRG
ncbi:MAG: hypothetical protein H6732_04460 [Alphaproteobacteria bacterium]|nr:hypothetical protein [Alphaproteobacteria bacterium]